MNSRWESEVSPPTTGALARLVRMFIVPPSAMLLESAAARTPRAAVGVLTRATDIPLQRGVPARATDIPLQRGVPTWATDIPLQRGVPARARQRTAAATEVKSQTPAPHPYSRPESVLTGNL